MTTEPHVPVEHLAAYAAGDLDATASLEVEAHVLLCEQCRADADAVNRATSALSSLPPVSMPADVAARVDAALAGADASGPAGDVLPLAPKRRRPSLAGIAAVAAGFALVGAISVPILSGGDEDPASTGALNRESATETKRLESGLNYSHGALGDTLLRALSGTQDQAGRTTALTAKRAATDAAAPNAPSPSASGTTTFTSGESFGAPAPQNLAVFQADPGRLAACVAALGAAQPAVAQKPLLIDFALFDGNPALVVVFPTVRGSEIRPDRIDVYVTGPRCGITPGDDDVLDFARFERPSRL